MARIRLTKNELRVQEHKLGQLEKYLPTLQLKKAMLQSQVNQELLALEKAFAMLEEKKQGAYIFAHLLSGGQMQDFFDSLHIDEVYTNLENIAGLEVPIFDKVHFSESSYDEFSSPLWFDSALVKLKDLLSDKEYILVLKRRKELLEKELRDVSIRVNLFEKILIPKAKENIKKIKIFLGDQQLAAVAQAKVAKMKIIASKEGQIGDEYDSFDG